MKLTREIKSVDTYIKDIKSNRGFSKENVTVEHRSNNPKRDYLFVNKKQCKHIPSSGAEMVKMCKLLANEVNDVLANELPFDSRVLVVGFAETATAIGNCVADNLCVPSYVMQTTRENVPGSKELLRFEEEHSHATTQKLLTYEDTDVDKMFSDIEYILFVEDEISTGNTILNFIKEFEKLGKNIRYGVASVCNWQNEENIKKFKDKNIDRFVLVQGKLIDTNVKMLDTEECKDLLNSEIKDYTRLEEPGLLIYNGIEKDLLGKDLFKQERLGHKPNRDLSKLYELVNNSVRDTEAQSVRVVGTEEFMYIPIKVSEYIEKKMGIKSLCHSTTRSPIDVFKCNSFGTADAIKTKNSINSVYDHKRVTYLYNLDEQVDVTFLITDGEFDDSLSSKYFDMLSKSSKHIFEFKL